MSLNLHRRAYRSRTGRVIDGCQHTLEKAARLCSVELRCGVTLYPKGEGWTGFLGGNPLPRIIRCPVSVSVFDDSALSEIRDTYDLVTTVDAQFQDVSRAIDAFLALRDIDTSHLYVLGLFAIIESLLTHDPHGDYDSLGHQIKTKIPLLARRMKYQLDYGSFGGTDVGKIWSKLYTYRSCIAHGGNADFKSSLKLLKSAETSKIFLETAVKRLIRHALTEPELVLDLRTV